MNSWIGKAATLLLAVSCAVPALNAGWVNFSMRAVVRGRKFMIADLIPGGPPAILFSYGFAVALLCVVGLVACWRNRPRLLAWTSIGLLLLALGAFLQVAFANAPLLRSLLSDHQQYRDSEKFAKRNLPTNLGLVPTKKRELSSDTFWKRIAAAQFFMGFGWSMTLATGIAGVIRAVRQMPAGRDRWQFGLLAGTVFVAAGVVGVARPALAQWTLTRAIESESKGDLDRALAGYREAMRLDPWFALDSPVRQRIGAIDETFGRTNTVDACLYRVEARLQQADYLSAIAEIEKHLRGVDTNSPVLRQRAGALWALQGRALYSRGAVGDAALAWQNALLYDPHQLFAGFCLSSAYYDLGRYADCIQLAENLGTTIQDPYIQSQLLSNQGDAYTKLGELVKARFAYQKSYKLDSVVNWRALSALVGGN